LALVLIFNPNLFDGLGGMAYIAAWWGIWHIISGLLIAGILSKKPLNKKLEFKIKDGFKIKV
jgi:BASS family bile acid:Na+ symporter